MMRNCCPELRDLLYRPHWPGKGLGAAARAQSSSVGGGGGVAEGSKLKGIGKRKKATVLLTK